MDMEYNEVFMKRNYSDQFGYISDADAEKASNSYLMSMVAIMAGIGLPIVNLIATLIFFLAQRKSGYFVRWHATQALLSQLILVGFNSAGFIWLMSILFGDKDFTNKFIAYITLLIVVNLFEFIATIYAAMQTRKAKHVEWWLLGPFTQMIVKP
jgi:uncharacterized membrane protein